MRFVLLFSIISLLIALAAGCSSEQFPVQPESPAKAPAQAANHYCMGYYQFVADPARGTLECTPRRDVAMHLNALRFLEPPALLFLSLESLEFNGDIVEAGIGIRHPFLGLTEFTGFDVCGILITNGSKADFDDPELRMAVEGDTRLLNPDGYSRWWNPAEFPHDATMFSYIDGLLGTPDSTGNYSCTLNAYKFFCDDIENPKDELSELDPSIRCVFRAGQKNIRHYTIELGAEGLIFNYAVDACWQFPEGNYPWQVPDDFSENANRPEAWNVSITELENTLWNDGVASGGDLSLEIDVWDHFHADLNTVKAESPGNMPPASSSIAIGGGAGYSTYQVDINNATPSVVAIELLISVESEAEDYDGLLPGKQVAAYFTYTAMVDDEAPQQEEFHEYWACAGYNHYNLCRNPTDQTIDLLNMTQVWSNTTSGSTHGFKAAGVAIADGKVFYTSETGNYYWPSTQYRIYCLDLNDGHELWQQFINLDAAGGRAQTSPVWYDDKVYVGGDHVYCFDDETGAEIWRYDGAPSYNFDYPNNSPKVYDGRVYCTSQTAFFCCLDAETGAEQWIFPYENSELLPATDGERVYFPGRYNFFCCDCETGELLWTQPIQGDAVAWSGPALAGDRVYQHGWYGWLHCFDKYTGNPIWSYDIPSSGTYFNAMPAQFVDPADGKLVFVAGSANPNSPLFAIKDDGPGASEFWTGVYPDAPGDEYYDATCTIHEDYIAVGDRFNARLFIIDKLTGELLKIYPAANRITAQVGIAYNRLIVLTDDSVECYM
jgi:outer membrane protein assembly factor BamB